MLGLSVRESTLVTLPYLGIVPRLVLKYQGDADRSERRTHGVQYSQSNG
jgi:hypothetical protein